MLDARVDRLEAARTRLAEAQARTEAELRRLAEAQTRSETELRQPAEAVRQLTARLDHVDDRTDRLVGRDLERLYRDHAPAFSQSFLRRIRLLDQAALEQVADDAERRGHLTQAEHSDLLYADVVAQGRSRETDAEAYLLAEVSLVMDTGDVERAARRAVLLHKATAVPAIAVVAGERILPEADRQAQQHRVWRVLDGRAAAPPP